MVEVHRFLQVGLLVATLPGVAVAQGGPRVLQAIGSGVQGFDGDGGPAHAARLNQPFDLAFDRAGNAYLTDTFNHALRKWDRRTGTLSILAGLGKPGYLGDGGPARQALLNEPYGVVVDHNGDLYFADRLNLRVRRVVAATGRIETVAGTGERCSDGDGGPAVKAALVEPNGVALDGQGRLLIADVGANRVRVVDLKTGQIDTFAGTGESKHSGDGGPAKEASLHGARAVEVDAAGNVYILEREGHRLRVVDAGTGRIVTAAGTGFRGYRGDGGPALEAELNGPKEMCLLRDGSILIVDTENHAIRRFDPRMKTLDTFAGMGKAGAALGDDPRRVELNRPHGVAEAPDGSVWIVDTNNHRVLRVEP